MGNCQSAQRPKETASIQQQAAVTSEPCHQPPKQAAKATCTTTPLQTSLLHVPINGSCSPLLQQHCLETFEVEFSNMYPAYAKTKSHFDSVRREEYGRLDEQGHIYLDYTGGSLYSKSQIMSHSTILCNSVLGNPHSINPTSHLSTVSVETARRMVFEYFNADPREYEVIFTLNASGALRIVGESYPFTPSGHYVYLADNHNSVVGIREFARTRGAKVTFAPVSRGEVRIMDDELMAILTRNGGNDGVARLFSYPAQSNLSGVKHSLDYVKKAQQLGWDVLLDASAFVPTNSLDLSVVKPDYVAMSFYKVFGYPTGVGALIAQKASLRKLHRPWFAGGTIEMVSIVGDTSEMARGDTNEAYEDGTLNFLAIPAIATGLKWIQHLSMENITLRVRCLTDFLLKELQLTKHWNGEGVVQILGPRDIHMRGGTVALLFKRPDGRFFNIREVERRANEFMISIRTGCFCNPGGMEMQFNVTKEAVERALSRKRRKGFILKPEYVESLGADVTEALRVSFGLMSNERDAFLFLKFVASFTKGEGEDETSQDEDCVMCSRQQQPSQ